MYCVVSLTVLVIVLQVDVLISLISRLTTHIDYICARLRLVGLLVV